ncbi:hypothetical protein FSP39_000140 [Pinctada imbricata]|uniref:Sex-determining region Y protein n=1 Tax=Pinctada imbricata TaxID=66713 RepID=A0AA88YA10_PINIB|nr:hypothetical protein FSP39_000140 [Pinctada imbricata]
MSSGSISEEEKQTAIQNILSDNNCSRVNSSVSSVANQNPGGQKTKVIYVQPSTFPENFQIFHQAGSKESKQVHTVYAKSYGQYISQDNRRNDATTNIQASHNGHIYYVSPDGSMRQATTMPNVLTNESKQVVPTVMPGTNMEYKTPGASFVNRQGKVKRPMNAFMLWARTYRSKIAQQMTNSSNSEISIRLGQIWSSLPVGEKQPFYLEAERIKNRHRQCFPDWVYQPRKTKKPFLYSQVQHSRLWEKHSDQYAVMKSSVSAPRFNCPTQRPAYRPIAPAAPIRHVADQTVVVSNPQSVCQTSSSVPVRHSNENQRHFAQLFGDVAPQRSQLMSVVPSTLMGETFQNNMSSVASAPLPKEERLDELKSVPFQKILPSIQEIMKPQKTSTKSQSEGNTQASAISVKQSSSPMVDASRTQDPYDKSEVIWPFPLNTVEKHTTPQPFYEETVPAQDTQRQTYMDPYDPFYYKPNFSTSNKTSGDQLNVDVASWQQYLNDYGQAKGSTEQKEQLGSYFSIDAKSCPSDLEICPTPVASTLHRNEEDSSWSADVTTRNSVPPAANANAVSFYDGSNRCPQEHIADPCTSVQQDQTSVENKIAEDASTSNTLSFGNVMSQAVEVLNNDSENYQYHGMEERECIEEEQIPMETTCVVEDIGNQSSKIKEIVIAPFQNQENLPFKKRTDRLYQEYTNDDTGNVREQSDSSCNVYKTDKTANDNVENENTTDDTYEITISRCSDGEEITATTIYIPRDSVNGVEGKDVTTEPHAVLTVDDSLCTRDGDREDLMQSMEQESSDSLASGDAVPISTKRPREQDCDKGRSKRRVR